MKTITLSDGEWKLMNVLWDSAPCTITQLVLKLKDETGWSKHTIITMLNRLEAKQAVKYTEIGRAKQFYPHIDREHTQLKETQNFLSKLYGGSLGLMLNTMVQEKALDKKEIDELYEILKKAEEEEI